MSPVLARPILGAGSASEQCNNACDTGYPVQREHLEDFLVQLRADCSIPR